MASSGKKLKIEIKILKLEPLLIARLTTVSSGIWKQLKSAFFLI
jgi:hypothetical protein